MKIIECEFRKRWRRLNARAMNLINGKGKITATEYLEIMNTLSKHGFYTWIRRLEKRYDEIDWCTYYKNK